MLANKDWTTGLEGKYQAVQEKEEGMERHSPVCCDFISAVAQGHLAKNQEQAPFSKMLKVHCLLTGLREKKKEKGES